MKKFFILLSVACALFCLVSCSEFKSNGIVHIVSVGAGNGTSIAEACIFDAEEIAGRFDEIYKKKNISTSVNLLTDTNISRETLLNALSNIDASSEDLIIFYYSGHGGNCQLATGNDSKDAKQHTPMTSVTDILASKECKCVAIIDACEIGAQYENGTPGAGFESLFKEIKISNVSVIASSSKSQYSQGTDKSTSHSLYTRCILDALASVSASDKLTTKQLYDNSLKFNTTLLEYFNQDPEINFNEIDIVIIP